MPRLFNLKSMATLTAAPLGRRGSGRRAVAKKMGLILRDKVEGKVKWEMLSTDSRSPVDDSAPPTWFCGTISKDRSGPQSPPAAPVIADMKLPFEMWLQVFHHLEDGYDIHALARVCKGMQDVAQEAIERHAAWVKICGVVKLTEYDAVCELLDLASAAPRIALAVRDLTITVPVALPTIVHAFPNIRRLALHVPSHKLGALSLPHLRVFDTSLAYSLEVAQFVARHPKVEELTVPDLPHGFQDYGLEAYKAPPALRKLSCSLPVLEQLGWMSARSLTHLHILTHAPNALEKLASLLGPQLVSLRLGVLERFPDLNSPRAVWSLADIMTCFPRLRYVQVHLPEPDLIPHPIQWQQKRDKGLQIQRRAPLTVAWVLEEAAWGTLLDPRDADIVRQMFDEVALDVLRGWAPYITRVVYGDAGVPDTCVALSPSAEGVVYMEDEVLGEDYWKRV